ncbi:MAG: type II toxin-antitoxin system Phd/YefM family antitoxin [Gammaproteobacteria bacterium]|nr:type II toxin-antitoxin system Phd/YefM family antitoxin [Gammaproteobacteria bacterium]
MFTMDSIHPVSDFSRKPAEHIKRLKETGQPEILTVNGKAELVIQSAKAYEEMMGLLGTLEKIARAAKSHDEGKGVPVDRFFEEFEKKHGLKRDVL